MCIQILSEEPLMKQEFQAPLSSYILWMATKFTKGAWKFGYYLTSGTFYTHARNKKRNLKYYLLPYQPFVVHHAFANFYITRN